MQSFYRSIRTIGNAKTNAMKKTIFLILFAGFIEASIGQYGVRGVEHGDFSFRIGRCVEVDNMTSKFIGRPELIPLRMRFRSSFIT